MAIKGYCGNRCYDCEHECELSMTIPCSPNCDNLTEDAKIKIKNCLEEGCPEVRYIFDMVNATDEEVIREYGEIAEYPYCV